MKLSRGLSRNNNGIAARTATIAPTPENTLPKMLKPSQRILQKLPLYKTIYYRPNL